MKKITLLFASLLCVAYIAVAQLKLYVYQNDGTRTEFVASTVDSIAFSTITDSPDQPDDPIKPVDPINGYEYVDLGLPSGTKWATMNVGADSPEEYGDYFAWGETTPKSTYSWSSYKWMTSGMSSCNGVNKYTIADGQTSGVWYSYGNFIGDNKTTLDLSDDAAYVNWGISWRMPTKAEQNELRNTSYTTWTWTTQNGVKGYKVTSKINGNSIFLPAAGYRNYSDLRDAGYYGYYWSSSLYTYSSDRAYYLYFNSGIVDSYDDYRNYGRSVRPVLRVGFAISFDANGGTGTMSAMFYKKGETKVLTANKFTRTGYFFNGWNTKSDGTGTPYTDKQSITPTENLTLYAQWKPLSGTSNGYNWIDLGLPSGTKWATRNVGADSPEEYGDYFAWGETESKSTYNWETYKWCNGSSSTQTKYCTDSRYGIVDNKTTLDLSDDAAYVNWGSSWRMPTKAEYDELINTSYTTWTWTTQNGVKGYKVTSKTNGNSIFLPAAGYRSGSELTYAGSNGYYRSSSLNTDYSYNAYHLGLDSYGVYSSNYSYRYYGRSVRPVLFVEFTISFDANGGTGTMSAMSYEKGETKVLTANKFTRTGYIFKGWNTKSDGTGTPYTDKQSITPTENLTLYAQWENAYAWVDLGLPSGTKWATCNVGADSPEEYGDHFAWGETEPKETYDWSTYKWCNGSYDTQNKYCTSSSYGTVDNKTTLDLSDDAAYVNWGSSWRMPTKAEQDELRNTSYTTWIWTTQNGVKGYKVTSKTNGNSIFLPAAGYRSNSDLDDAGSYGSYWSSSLGTSGSSYAFGLYFGSSDVNSGINSRDIGQSVRPVLFVEFTISFDANGGTGTMSAMSYEKGETKVLTANKFTRIGYIFKGWNTKSDGTGTPYTDKQSITPTENLTLYAQWEESKETGTANGYAWVDLGLPSGTKWATMNVGATSPEEYGDHFAWGETTTKSTYNWSTYKWCNGSNVTMTKYSTNSYYGTVDNKTTLDLSDDAAYVNWGTSWRMPTRDEQDELSNTSYTTWTWITQNGVKGCKVTSKINGNSIFLPAAGVRYSDLINAGSRGYYWSSSLETNSSHGAYGLSFYSGDVDSGNYYRYQGQSVRPVLAE